MSIIGLPAVIDTGFTEFLIDAATLLQAIGAVPEGDEELILGDGRPTTFDIYRVEVEWLVA